MEDKDDRPLVKALLKQHASKLTELRSILEKEDSFSEEHYDDLWMLRFLLSHKKVSKASAAAINTMRFRQEHKLNELGDIRHKLLDHMDHRSERYFDINKKYLAFCKSNTALMYAQPDLDRGLIQIISPRHIDMAAVVENMSVDEVLNLYLMTNEIIYQILDEVTRRTGRLTKLLRIMDATGFAFSSFNGDYVKRDAAANKQLEDFYPQMLGKVIISDMASWATTVWRLFKPFFPKRFVEKMALVKPGKNSRDAREFLRYISEDDLWERYGGKNADWPIAQPVHLWEKQ
jgi:hypothetical protein